MMAVIPGISKALAPIFLIILAHVYAECPVLTPAPVTEFALSNHTVTPNTEVSMSIIGGSGDCLHATWIDSESIYVERADTLADIPARKYNFTEHGTYVVTLVLSNENSFKSANGYIQVDDPLVGTENSSITHTLWDEPNFLNIPLTSGSRYCVFIDWDDDVVEEQCYSSQSDYYSLGHLYDTAGPYNVTLTLSNSLGLNAISQTVWVEYEVKGITVSAEYTVLLPVGASAGDVIVTFNADPGFPAPTQTNCSFLDTDNATELYVSPIDFVTVNYTDNITVPVPAGYHQIHINCSNHASRQWGLSVEVEVVEEMREVVLSVDAPLLPYVPVKVPVEFKVTMTNGSNVTLDVDFGDGSTPTMGVRFPNVTAWSFPVRLMKQYSTVVGEVTVNVTARNSLGAVWVATQFIVTVPIIEVYLNPPSPLRSNTSFLFGVKGPVLVPPVPPASYNCSFAFGDGTRRELQANTTGVAPSADGYLDTRVYHHYARDVYGELNTSVACWNVVSNLSAHATVEIRQPIEGLAVSRSDGSGGGGGGGGVGVGSGQGPLAVAVLTNASFDVSITSGNKVTVAVLCGTTAAPDMEVALPPGPSLRTVVCSYALPGTYTLKVIAVNGMSFMTATVKVVAQEPVVAENAQFASTSPQPNPPGAVRLLLMLRGPPLPTDASVSFDFDGDGANDTEEMNAWILHLNAQELRVDRTFPPDFLGTFRFAATVKNLVSQAVLFTNVTLVKQISEVTARTDKLYLPALSPSPLYVLVKNGSHVTISCDFGDGSSTEVLGSTTTGDGLVDGIEFPIIHQYNSSGFFPLAIRVSNALGEVPYAGGVNVRWPLARETTSLEHPTRFAAQDSQAAVTIRHEGSHPEPEAVSTTVYYPNGIVYNPPPSVPPWPIVLTLDYGALPDFGLANTTIVLDNVASEIRFEILFLLSEYIESAAVSGPELILEGETGTYSFSVVKGWNVSVLVSLDDDGDDGSSPSTDLRDLNMNFTYFNATVGVRTLTAFFVNDISNVTVTRTISVVQQLQMELVHNAPLAFGEPLRLTFKAPEGTAPNFVTFAVDFGDGDFQMFSEMWVDGNYTVTHTFDRVGSFPLLAGLDNALTTQVLNDVIHVDVPVTGVQFSVYAEDYNFDNETNTITYEPGVDIIFTGSVHGSRVNASFDIGGGLLVVEGLTANYSFADDGVYAVTFRAENFVSRVNVTQMVTIISPVGLESYSQPEKIYLRNNLLIDMTFDAPKNLCLHFLFEAGSRNLVRFYETRLGMCADHGRTYDGSSKVRLLPWSDTLQVKPLFPTHGEFTETLNMFTESASQTKTFTVYVQEHACEDPSISVPDGPGKYLEDPRRIYRSDFMSVTAEDMTASTNCEVTSLFDVQWRIFALEDSDDDAIGEEMVDWPGVDTSTKFFMSAERRALQTGLYRVQMDIIMSGYRNFNNSGNIFVAIRQSPLRAAIDPESKRRVGNVRPIHMNCEEDSYDPDVDLEDDPDLLFTWFCRRVDESLAIPEDPALDSTVPVVHLPEEGDPPSSQGQGGGCFGTGPGRLDVTLGNFSIPSKHALVGEYVYTVRIQKGNRTALADQNLTIVDGDPLVVEIVRDTPEKCAGRYNPTGVLRFYSKCIDCGEAITPTYEWQMMDVDGNMIDLGSTATTSNITGGIDSQLTLNNPPLDFGSRYLLRLHARVTSGDFDDGIMEISFETSSPPVNGSCEARPHRAVFLEQRFTISCMGWQDDDIDPSAIGGIDYSYSATVAGRTLPLIASNTFLPLGDASANYTVTVTANVTDACGSTNTQEFSVQVFPPEDGKSPAEVALEMLKALNSEGMKLEASVVSSLVDVISFTVNLTDPANAEIQDAVADTMGRLLLTGDSYPGAALLSVSDAMGMVASSLSPSSSDDAFDKVYDIVETLTGALGSQKSQKDLTRMSDALIGIAASCLRATSETQAVQASTTVDPYAAPDPVEDMSPEDAREHRSQELAKKKERAMVIVNLIETLSYNSIQSALRRDHDVVMGMEALTISVSTVRPSHLASTVISNSDSTISFSGEGASDRGAGCGSGGKTLFQSSFVAHSPFTYDESAGQAHEAMSSLQYFSGGCGSGRRKRTVTSRQKRQSERSQASALSQEDFYGDFDVEFRSKPGDRLQLNMTSASVDVNTSMIYFTLELEEDDLGFVVDLEPIDGVYNGEKVEMFAVLQARQEYLYKPRQEMYDVRASLPRNSRQANWSVVFPEDLPKKPLAYIGLLVLNSSFTPSAPFPTNSSEAVNITVIPDSVIVSNSSAFPFRVYASLAGCRNWDSSQDRWTSGSCKLSNSSTTLLTRCECTSATSNNHNLSPGFKVPSVNTINFSNIFKNFSALLAANPGVFIVIFCLLGAYILLLIWARRADIADIEKWSVRPLVDNKPSNKYYYHLTVMTGVRRNSGTRSNIFFTISGEKASTEMRVLDDGYNKAFGRGTVRRLLMATPPGGLGQLTYFHVWHDNSGTGAYQGWFLDRIVMEDAQTGETFHFLCDRWLAVDEEDGRIERVLPVAGSEQIQERRQLFLSSSRKRFADEHLWVSVFARPERSTFTRTQRLTAGVALLFATMIADAMWYREDGVSSDEGDAQLRLGPLVISAATVFVSVMASLCSIPVSTVIILLFQKSRPRPLKPGEAPRGTEPPPFYHKPRAELTCTQALQVKRYRRRYPFPWWCSRLAWLLSVLTILLSGFFVILYSLEWGKPKADGWLSAFFLSFVQNVLIVQPFKVIALALVFSCIFRKLDEADEKADKDSANIADTDASAADTKDKKENLQHLRVDEEKLETARKIGLRDKLMWRTLKEIVLYTIFLILIMYLAWGNRTGSDYFIKRSVYGMLNSKATGDYMSIEKVNDGHKMWRWLKDTLVPNMYWQQDYNGNPTSRSSRHFINDQNSVRLGTVRLRQLRVQPARCDYKIPSIVCRPSYGVIDQEDRDFTVGWFYLLHNASLVSSRLEKAFTFKSFIELQNIPVLGVLDTYSGGGYVAELGSNQASALSIIEQLRVNDWVDKNTRAVLFETTIYNANVHIFATISCMFEFLPTGGVVPRLTVDTFHAYAGIGFKGTVTLVLMVIFVLILLYLLAHEALKIKADRRTYFENPWNILEVIFLVMAFTAVGMYSVKEAYSRYITNMIREDKDANIGYMQLSAYEIAYNAVVGLITWVATFKMLRLLNFSSHVRHLSHVMRLVRRDLFSYVIVFFSVYTAFTCYGLLTFGRHLYDYSTYIRTLESLYSTLLGKFNYRGLYSVSRIFGPLFLMCFSIVIMFIMINLLIGLVTASFTEARLREGSHIDDEVWTTLLQKIKVFLHIEKAPEPPNMSLVESVQPPDTDGAHVGPEDTALSRRREEIRSLDIHLTFLDSYVENVFRNRKSASGCPGKADFAAVFPPSTAAAAAGSQGIADPGSSPGTWLDFGPDLSDLQAALDHLTRRVEGEEEEERKEEEKEDEEREDSKLEREGQQEKEQQRKETGPIMPSDRDAAQDGDVASDSENVLNNTEKGEPD